MWPPASPSLPGRGSSGGPGPRAGACDRRRRTGPSRGRALRRVGPSTLAASSVRPCLGQSVYSVGLACERVCAVAAATAPRCWVAGELDGHPGAELVVGSTSAVSSPSSSSSQRILAERLLHGRTQSLEALAEIDRPSTHDAPLSTDHNILGISFPRCSCLDSRSMPILAPFTPPALLALAHHRAARGRAT